MQDQQVDPVGAEPVASAVRTACAMTSGGVWNIPKPSAGIRTSLC